MKRGNRSTTSPAARVTTIAAAEPEIYTPGRLAEFFLNNAMDKLDYLSARKEVESMGIDPG